MADALRQKLLRAAQQANVTLCIALADQLGVFKALTDAGSEENPAHFNAVALLAGLKPRYVKELLSALAVGEIIQVTPDGEHFWVSAEEAVVFSSPAKEPALALSAFLPIHGATFQKIANVFKKDGPLGMEYADYTQFYNIMEEFSVSLHKKHLVPDLIPLAGVEEILKKGGRFLDVGCGGGFHVCELAESFPNSHFVGVDLNPSAIAMANKRKDTHNLTNVEFVESNAKQLDTTWTNTFDVVSIFDACHDQCRPDLAIKEINRVLRPGGRFMMIEIKGTSNVYTDIQAYGSIAAIFYTASVMHCLAVGSNSPDALGLGTMMGVKKGTSLLKDAGFNNIRIEDLPFFDFNVLYLAEKDA